MDDSDDEIQSRTIAAVTVDLGRYTRRYRQLFGHVVNADNASELFWEYSASRDTRALRGAAVRAAARIIVESVYAELLAEPVPEGKASIVVFTSGGNGAGKSTSVTPDDVANVVFDSTLSQLEPSVAKIEEALAAGRDVEIRHVDRDPIDAWKAVLARARESGEGRTVTMDGHLATHRGARQTLFALAERYAGNERVEFDVVENHQTSLVTRSVDWLRQQEYPDLNGLRATLQQILEEAHVTGAITDAIYRSATGATGRTRRDPAPGEGDV